MSALDSPNESSSGPPAGASGRKEGAAGSAASRSVASSSALANELALLKSQETSMVNVLTKLNMILHKLKIEELQLKSQLRLEKESAASGSGMAGANFGPTDHPSLFPAVETYLPAGMRPVWNQPPSTTAEYSQFFNPLSSSQQLHEMNGGAISGAFVNVDPNGMGMSLAGPLGNSSSSQSLNHFDQSYIGLNQANPTGDSVFIYPSLPDGVDKPEPGGATVDMLTEGPSTSCNNENQEIAMQHLQTAPSQPPEDLETDPVKPLLDSAADCAPMDGFSEDEDEDMTGGN